MINGAKTCARLIEFEERAAALYLALARRFTSKKDLSWFWLELSMEERQHALLLDFCGCQQMVTNGLPDKHTVQKLSDLFEDLERRARRKKLAVDEAFLIAAELEGSEINDIYAGVIGPIQGTDYILRKKIETLIPDHMQNLVRAARKFGVSEPTLARLVEIKRRDAPKRNESLARGRRSA